MRIGLPCLRGRGYGLRGQDVIASKDTLKRCHDFVWLDVEALLLIGATEAIAGCALRWPAQKGGPATARFPLALEVSAGEKADHRALKSISDVQGGGVGGHHGRRPPNYCRKLRHRRPADEGENAWAVANRVVIQVFFGTEHD